jgi:hypothetical protein
VQRHEDVFPPSVVVAVIVAVPVLFAVTVPLPFTVATDVLLLDHVTLLSEANAGDTCAIRVSVWP